MRKKGQRREKFRPSLQRKESYLTEFERTREFLRSWHSLLGASFVNVGIHLSPLKPKIKLLHTFPFGSSPGFT